MWISIQEIRIRYVLSIITKNAVCGKNSANLLLKILIVIIFKKVRKTYDFISIFWAKFEYDIHINWKFSEHWKFECLKFLDFSDYFLCFYLFVNIHCDISYCIAFIVESKFFHCLIENWTYNKFSNFYYFWLKKTIQFFGSSMSFHKKWILFSSLPQKIDI